MFPVHILKAFLSLVLANHLQEIKLNPAYLADAGALGPLVGAGFGVGGLAGRRAGLRCCAGVGKGAGGVDRGGVGGGKLATGLGGAGWGSSDASCELRVGQG